MSGHSKWHNIQKKKGAADAKRGQLFTKIAKAITLAAKDGGADTDMNFQLRVAVDAAKGANMPKANIERAIERGVGGGAAGALQEQLYEVYAPGGVAMIVEAVTDNVNRTVAEIKSILNKNGGSLGATGSVQWMFERKAVIRLSSDQIPEDRDAFELALIDAGVDNIEVDENGMTIIGDMKSFKALKDEVDKKELETASAGLEYVENTTTAIDDDVRSKLEHLMDALDDHDDVVNVYANDQ